MEHKAFLDELAKTLVSVTENIQKAVIGKTNAINDSKDIIQKEYDNIKVIRVEIEEIGFVLDDFADDIKEIVDCIDDACCDTDDYIGSMVEMVECGYIVDDDVVVDEFFLENVIVYLKRVFRFVFFNNTNQPIYCLCKYIFVYKGHCVYKHI